MHLAFGRSRALANTWGRRARVTIQPDLLLRGWVCEPTLFILSVWRLYLLRASTKFLWKASSSWLRHHHNVPSKELLARELGDRLRSEYVSRLVAALASHESELRSRPQVNNTQLSNFPLALFSVSCRFLSLKNLVAPGDGPRLLEFLIQIPLLVVLLPYQVL